MKDLLSFLIGIALVIVGGFLFLDNITVYGMGRDYYIVGNRVHMGTGSVVIIVIIMVFCFVAMVMVPNFLTKTLMVVSSILFVIAIILSLHFEFRPTNAFVTFAMLAAMFGGLGLILKAALGLRNTHNGENGSNNGRK